MLYQELTLISSRVDMCFVRLHMVFCFASIFSLMHRVRQTGEYRARDIHELLPR